jgi:hypothetical protein
VLRKRGATKIPLPHETMAERTVVPGVDYCNR